MEMEFTTIAKMIHPDTNPDITDASDKMTVLLKNRKDKKALWNLAVRWGLVEGEENVGVVVKGETVTIVTPDTGGLWNTGEQPTYQPPQYNFDEIIRQAQEAQEEWIRQQRINRIRQQQEWERLQQQVEREQRNVWETPPEPVQRPSVWEVPQERQPKKWWRRIIK